MIVIAKSMGGKALLVAESSTAQDARVYDPSKVPVLSESQPIVRLLKFDPYWEFLDDPYTLETPVSKVRRLLPEVLSEKFNESDWVRNRGRFADYTGQSGGGGKRGGGAGAASESTADPSYREVGDGGVRYVSDLAEGVKNTADYKVMQKNYFGSSTSVSINQELRHPTDDSPQHKYYKDVAAETVTAAHGAAVPLQEGVVSYRGLSVKNIDNFSEGVEFRDEAFTSTTLDSSWAGWMGQMWTDPKNTSMTPVVLKMRLPKGTRVVPHATESELLLLPGASFRVTGGRSKLYSRGRELDVIEVDMIGEGP